MPKASAGSVSLIEKRTKIAARDSNNRRSLLLSFKKEESSFLKKRSKRLLFLCVALTVRFRSEAWSQVVSLIGRGEQLRFFFKKEVLGLRRAPSVGFNHERGRRGVAIQSLMAVICRVALDCAGLDVPFFVKSFVPWRLCGQNFFLFARQISVEGTGA
jgi:hypothetical protein